MALSSLFSMTADGEPDIAVSGADGSAPAAMARSNGPIVALAIAVTKASLVVLFFMHVRYSTPLTWLVVASGFVWLAILLALAFADYLSRGWLGNPGT